MDGSLSHWDLHSQFTVSLNNGSKCEIPFVVPWSIIKGNTFVKQGLLSLRTSQSIHALISLQYEPLSIDDLLKDYDDVFSG